MENNPSVQDELTQDERDGLAAAWELIEAGVPVFIAKPDPGASTGYALPPGWQHTECDPGVLEAWQNGDALCAVMGHTLDLVDLDPRNDPDGTTTLGLTESGMMPTAYAVAETPSGGRHLFVAALGTGSRDNVRPGLDVKGGMADGSGRGFAFIAPTVRKSKATGELGTYSWLEAPSAEYITLETPGDDSGAPLAEMVRAAKAATRPAFTPPDDVDDAFRVTPPARTFTPEQARDYYMPRYEAFRAMSDDDHGFNAALNELAGLIGHFIPEFMTAERAMTVLFEAATHNGSVAYQGEKAVRKTIESGLQFGMREPYFLDESTAVVPGTEAINEGTPSVDPVDLLMGELLSAKAIREMPNPVPLIRGVLDLDSVSWLIGKSGSYKSFLALDWAAHVALGREWHGHAVTAGTVVYIVAEGARGMKLRSAAWEREHGELDNIWYLPRPVQAKDSAAWGALVEMCRRLEAKFVIIDTQARVTTGLDENDNSEMGVYVERADAIKRATGACVLTVHHIGRNGLDARGASAIDGAQDAEIRVQRLATEDRRITLHMDKQKDQDDSEELELELLVSPGGTDPATGRDLSSLYIPADVSAPRPPVQDWVDNLRGNQSEIVHILADHFPVGATAPQAERVLNERRGLADIPRQRMAHGSFTSAWGSLVKKEIILRVEGSQKYILPSISGEIDLS